MDKEKLVKLLNLTTSDNDGEALNAIRLANKILKAASMTWDDIIGTSFKKPAAAPTWGQTGPAKKPSARTEANTTDGGVTWSGREVEELLDHLDRNIARNSGFRAFVDDVRRQYDERGFLTRKQYQAVQKAARPRQRSFS